MIKRKITEIKKRDPLGLIGTQKSPVFGSTSPFDGFDRLTASRL
jgi:hypothetical protein